jgi:tetratricopeptide (TPR) repeat protein
MRLRKKLVRRLVVLAAGLALVGAALGGYATWRLRQIRMSYAADRQRGIAAARAGDDQTAIQLLERYARRYPLDADVLSLYARSRSRVELPNNRHIREAVLALRHLLQLDPQRSVDRLLLLDLYVRAGYATETLDVANTLLPSDPKAYSAADATVLSARTQALRWLGRYGEALQTAQRWSSVAPADLDAHLTVLS